MSENTTNPVNAAEIRPVSATIQLVASDNTIETIELNPCWVAMMLKQVRSTGPGNISLRGILPEDSPERTTVNSSWAAHTASIEAHQYKNWK